MFAPDPRCPRENFDDLRNLLLSISQWYCEEEMSAEEIEGRLHDAWDMLVQTSKITPCASPEQDSLVVLISSIKEFGILHHEDRDIKDQETAVLPNGQKLWIDLPYLAQEIQQAWIMESSQYTSTERANFAALTAKLCAVGICESELSFVALSLLKETLEVQRPLTKLPERHCDIPKSENLLSITELLPACFEWISNANFKLVKLAAQNDDPSFPIFFQLNDRIATDLGDLAVKAKVTQPGFSIARWLFWRLRLKELSRCGDEVIAKLAGQCFHEMIHTGIVLGIDVRGEKNYFEKVYEELGSELKRREGMIECVDKSDVNINMNWAD
jgi:hypothetical protein